MDGCSGKRAANGLIVARKGNSLVSRDNMNHRDKNVPVCSRIGCSARLYAMKGTRVDSSDKAKSAKPSFFPSSNGKEIAGRSSRSCSAIGNARKSSENTGRQLSSHLESDSSETSSVHDEPKASEALESIHPPSKIKRGLNARSENMDSREVISMDAGSSSLSASSRTHSHKRSGLGNQDAFVGSSVSLLSGVGSQAAGGNLSRNGLRNLRCNSISDVVPSASSSSDSRLNRRKDMFKKRTSDRESSSSDRGKKMSGPPVEGRNPNSSHGVSISDTRRNRNSPANRDNTVASVHTRRSTNRYSRLRHSGEGNGNGESPVAIPEVPQPETPFDLNPCPPTGISFSPPSSYSRPGSSGRRLHNMMPGSPSEVGITCSLMNRDSFRQYNMDRGAEVLLALERIEQDEELTYEQLLVLETNLFPGGLNFYDQHRDMRLDIDNMSYEELLALEERMGSVSTALSEESLSKCLKTSMYLLTLSEDETGGSCQNKDDVKCSICQEEYAVGDEVGRLHCEHRYHVGCIQRWLRMKNWCPICKAAAELSPASQQSSES